MAKQFALIFLAILFLACKEPPIDFNIEGLELGYQKGKILSTKIESNELQFTFLGTNQPLTISVSPWQESALEKFSPLQKKLSLELVGAEGVLNYSFGHGGEKIRLRFWKENGLKMVVLKNVPLHQTKLDSLEIKRSTRTNDTLPRNGRKDVYIFIIDKSGKKF